LEQKKETTQEGVVSETKPVALVKGVEATPDDDYGKLDLEEQFTGKKKQAEKEK